LTKKDLLRIPILEAFRQHRLCPLCLLWSKDETSYLQQVESNEMTADSRFRNEVVSSRGFCNRHMHMLFEVAFSGKAENGLGYARYVKDVIAELENTMQEIRSSLKATPARGRGLIPRGGRTRRDNEGISRALISAIRGVSICPVCSFLLESDARRMGTFLEMLSDDPEFAEQFGSSWGICVPHLSAVTQEPSGKWNASGEVANLLIDAELKNLRKVHRHLEERIRKYAWDFREEKITPEEGGSQTQALQLIAGCEGLYCKTRKGRDERDG
jgi:hypothetical protein